MEFSKFANGQGLAMGWNSELSAGTEDAMLLKLKLQGHAPITPTPGYL